MQAQSRLPWLTLQGLSKSYPGVTALADVSFSLAAGEVASLMGENGAGKSTLIKILAGLSRADAGQLMIDGEPVQFRTPRQAQEYGISVITQELSLIDSLSIAENIYLGREPRFAGFGFAKRACERAASRLLDSLGLSLDPRQKLGKLSVSQKQLVELAKALSFRARLIIMDEPTSSLTDQEAEILFSAIAKLRAEGVSILFVSHKLAEVERLSDRVHVLRDGRYIGCLEKTELQQSRLIQMMVGRELQDVFVRQPSALGETVLEVDGLSNQRLKDVSFAVRRGEILGFAGLVGSGRSELMRALFGLDPKTVRSLKVDGMEQRLESVQAAIAAGLGFVPEDRKAQGLILGMSVAHNTSLVTLKGHSRWGLLSLAREQRFAEASIKGLRIKTPRASQEVRLLSGGNQQKVVLAKWLAQRPKILIIDEPTRGIDVGAKKEIYQLLHQLATEGVAILLISSELPEILGLSDRIVVLHEGRKKGELSAAEASSERILHLALSQEYP